MAYTPGLERKELTLVRRIRRLPSKGKVLVKEGDTVSFDTIVARTEVLGNADVVNVAEDLGIDAETDNITKYMLKKVGDPVDKAEMLARLSALFGLYVKTSKSPTTGFVERISQMSGQVIIREPPVTWETRAYIPGVIREILPDEGVIIETRAAFIQGIFGVGGESHGEIKIVESSNKPFTDNDIGSESADKILVVKGGVGLDALKKAVKVGAKGVVAGGIDLEDLTAFIGHEIGVVLTGSEELGLTLIIMEGFGNMEMLDKTFALLKTFEGRRASINGATQIRAGVIRPEVIIPRNEGETPRAMEAAIEASEATNTGLTLGTLIRVIREPYFGALGHVVNNPSELEVIATESRVRVLVAELEDGRRVIVPRANVEIIGE
jgi:hypothetical protein